MIEVCDMCVFVNFFVKPNRTIMHAAEILGNRLAGLAVT